MICEYFLIKFSKITAPTNNEMGIIFYFGIAATQFVLAVDLNVRLTLRI